MQDSNEMNETPAGSDAQASDGKLYTFAVRRPYCEPERILILARSADEAVALANLCYGRAVGTVALRPVHHQVKT